MIIWQDVRMDCSWQDFMDNIEEEMGIRLRIRRND